MNRLAVVAVAVRSCRGDTNLCVDGLSMGHVWPQETRVRNPSRVEGFSQSEAECNVKGPNTGSHDEKETCGDSFN